MSARKIYSRDFKLKVLEYYFKHGGDKKFGLRAKTAHHFCIDHKTVSRMLCNADIVKKARRTLSKKSSSGAACKPPKPPSLKLMGQPFGGLKEVGVNLNSSEGTPASSPGSSKSFHSGTQNKMPSGERNPSSSEVPVIELPEDPDFSLLKKTIESPASAAANFARLLITGTKEVKRILSNECELIFECKVCRNLFRSIINFLAHKRVYCQEENVGVRNLFHKDSGLNMSSESSTIIVEPEPPPPKPFGSGEMSQSSRSELKIDRIAARLARRKRRSGLDPKELSSSTHTGSSEYYNKLEKVSELRKSMSSDCTVMLQDIAGVSSAVFQTFSPPNSTKSTKERTQEVVREVHQRKRREPVQLDPEGKVVKRKEPRLNIASSKLPSPSKEPKGEEPKEQEIFSCTSCTCTYPSKKSLESHIEEVHGIERTVYTCPICNMVFLSIWGCVKHLIRTHKKKKHQRERLKHVICSRAYTKLFTTRDIARHTHKTVAQVSKRTESKAEAPLEPKEVVSRVSLPKEEEEEEEPSTSVRTKTPILSHSCPRCGQTFQTPTAMGAHLQYCPLATMQNSFQSETPEKKIAIQIRKDYKKEVVGPALHPIGEKIVHENKPSAEVEARMKEICVLNRLYCVPCKRKYHTITVLKRHAAQHLDWTRFACARCSFRSYEKYMCTQHCYSIHRASDKNVDMMILKDEKLGRFKYHLTQNRSVSNPLSCGSRSDQEESGLKSDFMLNGGYSSSSECSASVVSDDSTSFKSELENQDLESANVAYRELIENVDITGDNSASKESKHSQEKSEHELKLERPQRTRKVVEQKDFVYEPLRPTSSTSRCDDDSRSPGLVNSVPHKRKSTSCRESLKKRINVKLPTPEEILVKVYNGRESPSAPLTNVLQIDEEGEKNPCTISETKVKEEKVLVEDGSKESGEEPQASVENEITLNVDRIKKESLSEKQTVCKEGEIEHLLEVENKGSASSEKEVSNINKKNLKVDEINMKCNEQSNEPFKPIIIKSELKNQKISIEKEERKSESENIPLVEKITE